MGGSCCWIGAFKFRGLRIAIQAPLDVNRWQATNFTTLNIFDRAPLPLLYEMPAGTAWSRVVGDSNDTPSNYRDDLVSLQYWDEQPLTTDFVNRAAAYFAEWRFIYPNTLAHTNENGIDVGMQNYMQTAKPDMIMFDQYPGANGSRFPTPRRRHMVSWYSLTQGYRLLGLGGIDGTGTKPIPYAQYLDLFRDNYSYSQPAESFVRLQQFASWAFGYTFVSAFVYNDTNAGIVPVMFSTPGDGSPTSTFYDVAETNRQSLNLGPALVRLVSTDIFMKPGSGQSVSGTGLTEWSSRAGSTLGYSDFITGVTPYTNSVAQGGSPDGSYSDILIGYSTPLLADNSDATFVDGLHFMIVNGSASGTAASAMQWYHVTFDFSGTPHDSLVRLSRDTGEVELVPLVYTGSSQYYLDLSLPGGTGDLFTFWNSDNPLPTIPEPGSLSIVISGSLAAWLGYIRRRRSNKIRNTSAI